MPSFLTNFLEYELETEWLLTWFPNRVTHALSGSRSRGGVFHHKNTQTNPWLPHSLGEGQGADAHGDALYEPESSLVHAFITIRVDPRDPFMTFKADLEVAVGGERRDKSIVLRPDTVTPFMVNVQGPGNNPNFANTTLTLQGVFTTSLRAGLSALFARPGSP